MKVDVVYFLLFLLLLPLAQSLSIQETHYLWALCRSNDYCASVLGLETPSNLGTTPLGNGDLSAYVTPDGSFQPSDAEEMMLMPQFNAFYKIVAGACARMEDPGSECSAEQVAQIPLIFSGNQSESETLRQLWLYRMMVWVTKSGDFCGFNQVIVINPNTGELDCQCRLNKKCGSDGNESFTDTTWMTVALYLLLIVSTLGAARNLIVFLWARIMQFLGPRGHDQINKLKNFINGPETEVKMPTESKLGFSIAAPNGANNSVGSVLRSTVLPGSLVRHSGGANVGASLANGNRKNNGATGNSPNTPLNTRTLLGNADIGLTSDSGVTVPLRNHSRSIGNTTPGIHPNLFSPGQGNNNKRG
jgi:hypothetical protein